VPNRYFLFLSYHGGNYHGYQIQKNAVTVQEVLQVALGKLLRCPMETTASGRTDTGVHALQQVVHFDYDGELPNDFVYRLNGLLPQAIVANSLKKVRSDAHARFSAIKRSYAYHIKQVKSPFGTDTSYSYFQSLDLEEMQAACRIVRKTENFRSFSRVKTDVTSFECKVYEACWEQKNDMLVFYVTANRFLRGMVRALVGTLLEIGSGKMSLQEFQKVIKSGDRRQAGRAVPPQGLFLTRVTYPEQIFIN